MSDKTEISYGIPVITTEDIPTLRDYFAGQALAGMLAGGFANTIPHDDINGGRDAAFFAYQYADAMLVRRAKVAP